MLIFVDSRQRERGGGERKERGETEREGKLDYGKKETPFEKVESKCIQNSGFETGDCSM